MLMYDGYFVFDVVKLYRSLNQVTILLLCFFAVELILFWFIRNIKLILKYIQVCSVRNEPLVHSEL